MDKIRVKEFIGKNIGIESVSIDEPMKNHTSFKIGGPADILALPGTASQLKDLLNYCRSESIPYIVMGKGTNLIVRDKGIRGIVIKICGNLAGFSVKDDIIEAETGILLSRLSNVAAENSLSGLEFASGIPGTFGGAVVMNAGAYIGEMKDVVFETEYIDMEGRIKTVEGEQHNFDYRTSFIQKTGGVVLKSKVRLTRGTKNEIRKLMDDLNQRRKDKQPLELPSAGSIFKRPEGFYAGKLIEDCDLKGYKLGGAEVSAKHCGFIVNTDSATASDVINLIRHIQGTVKIRFGVELQTEVKIVGEE